MDSPYDIDCSLYEGNYSIFVWANDTIGRVSFKYFEFTFDHIKPVITLVSPVNNTETDTLWVNLSISDLTLHSVWYSWDNGVTNNSTWGDYYNISVFFMEGLSGLTVWANDSVGNLNSSYFEFTSKLNRCDK